MGFAALGVWQLQRLAWKSALTARVEARLQAPPVDPPSGAGWSADLAYTRVRVGGVFHHELETPVQAVTERGPGWWILTPLETPQGWVLINRGWAPPDLKRAGTRPRGLAEGYVVVEGLLRTSEPGGAFLRSNAPTQGRWYSRDVAAIARTRGLAGPVLPYFVDASASAAGGVPVGGLTVVRFRNDHLAYAATWFGLACLSLGGAAVIWRRTR